MIVFFVLPALAMILVGVYLYFYVRRMLAFWLTPVRGKALRRIAYFPTFILVLLGINIWGIGAVIVIHLLVFVVIFDLIEFFRKRFKKEDSIKWTKIYKSGVIPIILTVIVLVYAHLNMMSIIETDYQIQTEKTIKADGYKIAMMSDLHYGTTIEKAELIKTCAKISEAKPDLFVLCGDIVDESTTSAQLQEAFSCLSSIKTTHGIFYVYGNHDKALYSPNPNFTPEQLKQIIEANGITVLEDDWVNVGEDLTLVGRADASSSARMSNEELLKEADKNRFLILLDHQPKQLQENSSAGYDLMLSGHTHGGQIWPMGFFNEFIGFGEMNYGYRQVGNMQVVVSSGIAGWGYAFRTGSHSEYVMIDVANK